LEEEQKDQTDGEVKPGVELFPNPVKDQINIRNNSSRAYRMNAYIIDFQGRLLHQFHQISFHARETLALDRISGLRSGGYVLRLEGDQVQFVTRFMMDP
jgi:hypothetical protein